MITHMVLATYASGVTNEWLRPTEMVTNVVGGQVMMGNTFNITTPNGVNLSLTTRSFLKNFVSKDFKQDCRG